MVLPGCTDLPEEEPVVAIINGRAISQNEFEVRWNELSQATRARYQKRKSGKRRFLDELIMRQLLIQEARKQGLDQSDERSAKRRSTTRTTSFSTKC